MQVTARHRLPCRQRARGLTVIIRAAQSTQQPVKPGRRQDAAPIDSFGFRPGFHDDFELGRMLGSGSFGVVHVAQHRKSGRLYAVKSIPKRFFGQHLEPHFVARIQHEVDVARVMGQSLNVVHLVEAYEDDVCVDLVMELAAGGNLWSRIKQGNYSEKLAARLISDMLRAVAQCHAKGIIVRDVKPENFLFLSPRDDSPLKLIDFGLADYCRPGEMLSERAGTPCYVAPEVLKQSYSLPADIWSVGVAAYQLLTGQLPWHTDADWLESQAADSTSDSSSGVNTSNKQLWRAILYGELDFEWPPWDTLSAGARDFVQSMLQRDPELRPTAAQLLQHPWLTGTSGTSSISMASVDTSAAAKERPLDDSLVQRLQRYGTWGRLKQLALRQVAKVMSADAAGLQGLAEAFAALDTAGTGRIPYSQLVELLRSEQYDLSDVEVRMLVCQFDLDTDGNVDYFEFVAALLDWSKAQSNSNWELWLQQVFEQFDVDKSGSISSSELGDLLGLAPACELEGQEPYVIEDTVPAALRHADVNGDGQLSFQEFAALLQTDAGDRLDLFASRRRRDQRMSAAVKQRFNASSTGANP